jgi:hypothetical protein
MAPARMRLGTSRAGALNQPRGKVMGNVRTPDSCGFSG